MEGSLNKWTNVMKGWQSRYFVLDDRKGALTYYTSKEKMTRGVSRGIVNLKGAVVTVAGCEEGAFTISVGSRTYHLMAKDEAERDRWVKKLEEMIPRLQDMASQELLHQKHRSEKPREPSDVDCDKKSKYPIITTTKGSTEKSKMSIAKCRSVEKQSVTTISYPSSGDDDDYFDAAEATSAEMDSTSSENQASAPLASEHKFRSCSDLSIFLKSDGTLDYDKMYEDSMESELCLENHGSIITHLISQVRVGMDLTKVTLPIFILERRSLLEMYADSFAHPEMFVSIADKMSERERMVQVVKWYLCSYHAGRKSKVPKKPYNPVLGEVFQCYWETESKSDEDYIKQNVEKQRIKKESMYM